ncbi:MAG: aldehyde ferredoxin oxidoreductase C-terminal domain-containing protein, partial [Deltaproteobacteria bacterium]|nr:aldehyde ferredoxin oxidoreductase C-terminal domain-containing protein [Deltaproteobacteria bacterium]
NPAMQGYKKFGTSGMVRVMNTNRAFPTRYWSQGQFENWEKISAETMHEKFDITPHACLRCFLACGRLSTIKEGRHAGLKIEGPEYETIFAFGGLCCIDQLEEIAYLNDLCDSFGMDTISAGNLCAFTIEAVRRKRVNFPIDYGDADGIAKLLKMIAAREGIGDILAKGIRYAAKAWDLEDMAIHVKGLEPPGYDPRVFKGVGLGYAVSDRGACHLRATFYKAELSGMIDRSQIEDKAKMLIDFEDRLILFDTLILCRFYRDLYPWKTLGAIIHGLTGLDKDRGALSKTASNIASMVRGFNIREGLTKEDDRLPSWFYRHAINEGDIITPQELEAMVADYYRLRGWDKEGRPVKEL